MTGKRIAKADLPVKICVVCQRPFAWRKKWRKVWEAVRYCSDACRRRRRDKDAGAANSRQNDDQTGQL